MPVRKRKTVKYTPIQINIHDFLLQNHDAIYNPQMQDHSLDTSRIREFQEKIELLPTFKEEHKEDLNVILNALIQSYIQISLCVTDNIIYVSFEEYLNTLRDICDDIIQHIYDAWEQDEGKKIVFYIDQTKKEKSNFWVFMLCFPFFTRYDIPIQFIQSPLELLELKDAYVVYPDDMSYSGTQFKEALILIEFNEDTRETAYGQSLRILRENRNMIIPMVSRISKRAVENLRMYENTDIFYLSKQTNIVESTTDILKRCKLYEHYVYMMDVLDKFVLFANIYDKYQKEELLHILDYSKDLVKKFQNIKMYPILQNKLFQLIRKEANLPMEGMLERFILLCVIDNRNIQNADEISNMMDNPRIRHYFIKDHYGLHLYYAETTKFLMIVDFLNKMKWIYYPEFLSTALICFQHKMADAISVPMFLFHNGAYITYKNDTFKLEHVGSFFKNCPKSDEIIYILADIAEYLRCPPSYYKHIKYNINDIPIDIGDPRLTFTYDYAPSYDSDDEIPISPLTYNPESIQRVRKRLLSDEEYDEYPSSYSSL